TLRALSSTRPPSTATYTLSLHDALPIWRIERLLRPEALAGGPGGEQTHGLLGLRTRFGRVDGEGRPVFGFDVHALVGQSHLPDRSEEHTSELQSRFDLVCRLLLEKKNKT